MNEDNEPFTTQGIQVTMIDKFMSGWGKSDGKVNYFVVECDTQEQAELIQLNASLRSDMANIYIINETKQWPNNVLVSLKHFDELGAIWKKPEVCDGED